MSFTDVILFCLLIFVVVLQIFGLLRKKTDDSISQFASLRDDMQRHQAQSNERLEREIRNEVQTSSKNVRLELSANLAQFQQTIAAQLTSVSTLQNHQLDAFGLRLAKLNEVNAAQLESMRQAITLQAQQDREEQASSLKRFGDTLNHSLTMLTESNAQRLQEVRATLEQKIKELQTDNGARLEEMRKTVDEKLHATLEQRLGESCKLV
jgi:DNA recombination protein RmuC